MGTHRTFIATYMMASRLNGAIYTGMTSNLRARVWKHKTHAWAGFTDDYAAHGWSGLSGTHGSSRPYAGRNASRSGFATGSWR